MTDSDPSEIVVAGYDRLAGTWDHWAETVQPPLRESYLDRLVANLSEGSRVLELGCGTGRPVAERLATRFNYIGIDVSPQMVATARRNVPAAEFSIGDMRHIEFDANSFDAVVAFHSIIHVPRAHHRYLYATVNRWLAPDGWFVASLTASNVEAGTDPDWLGAGPMFWSGFDAQTSRSMLRHAGFTLRDDRVRAQMEGDEQVEFLWIEAQTPGA
jgi:SAM-dependent methyltransferase